jgi:L-ascorbate metabolism protein UlaG (beta-lactamase superfamily)
MKITQIRNATILLELESDGQSVGILVDPMLSSLGALPSLRFLGGKRRRNPIVDLPQEWDALSKRVTHALITHCQRGHFDHLDGPGKRFLRETGVSTFCMPRDADYLKIRGLRTQVLLGMKTQPFLHGRITPVPCVHGIGAVGRFMEHGVGYLIEFPKEPSIYLAGDTLLTADVRRVLAVEEPDVAVLPAGGARFDVGSEILMNGADVLAACSLTKGVVIANHLEAVDHCPTNRNSLKSDAVRAGLGDRLLVPRDGETLEFAY